MFTCICGVAKVMRRADITRERQRRQILAEASLLRRVQHPFIVKLHGSFKSAKYICLLFEPLLGGDLFTRLTDEEISPGGVLPADQAAFYTACVAAALGHLHSLTIIYRDIKPENLMVSSHDF